MVGRRVLRFGTRVVGPQFLAYSVALICALVCWSAAPGILYAQTETQTEDATVPPPEFHVVVAGESLSVIAERHGVSLAELMALNGITDADSIRIGSQLRLPPGARPVVGVDPQFALDSDPAFHVVLPGESILGIALRYDLNPQTLMSLNGIQNPDHIVIGQRLRLSPPPATEPAGPALATGTALTVTQGLTRLGELTASSTLTQSPEISATVSLTESEPGTIETDTETVVEPEEVAPLESLTRITTLNRRVRVGPGESVAGLAVRHGVSESALRSLNGLGSEAFVPVDTELILPATREELRTPARTVVTPEDDRARHTVQPGDSLSTIAEQYGLTLADLLAANRITDPNTIRLGEELMIPDPVALAAETNADEESGPVQLGRPSQGYFYYTVQPGDTLSELAREFNTTWLAILDYNDLPDAETVFRGVELRIPFGPPVLPDVAPPSPQSGTRFVVSLSRQQCWVLQGDRVLHEWVCSTGYGEWITRTGVFAVQSKLEMAQSNYYELDMPYWLGIYDVGPAENGIHGLPVEWATGEKIWEGLLGQPATFGCAMLADDDAATLFHLAYLGMPVYIVN